MSSKIQTKECLFCKKIIIKPINESQKSWDTRHKYCSIYCRDKSKVGKKAWNKGLNMWSKEERINISRKLKGRDVWNKGKRCPQTSGKRNGNWKGGKSKRDSLIRCLPEYKDWRISVFERDGYACQKCGNRGGRLQAHHKKPFHQFKELRFDINNGETLCKECHRELHKKIGYHYGKK